MSQFIEMFGCLAERVALSSLCDTFIDGDWIEAKDQSGSGIRLIQTGNVGVGTFKDKGDRARYISEETFNRLNCTEVVEGDILISRLPEPVGRACIIPAGLGKSITAVDCTIIRLNDKVLSKFFVTFTNTPYYAMQIKKVLCGTTRLRVSRANLGKIQVPLPAIDKQQQFVTIAEQADKSGFDGFKSQFIEMFKGDNQVPLGDICNIEKGATITRNDVLPGEVPVVAGGQEPSCYHNVANREAGTITVSASGAYAGYINFWNCPIFASDCNTIISKDDEKTDQTFVYFGLRAMQKQIYGLQKGGAQPHVYGKDLQKFMFPCPSYAKQIEFSKTAKQADKSGSVLQHMIAC